MSRPTRNTRRTNTPALNRRRAVEYRHRKYAKSGNLAFIDSAELALNNDVIDNAYINEEVVDDTTFNEVELDNNVIEENNLEIVKEDSISNNTNETKEELTFSQKVKNYRKDRRKKKNAYLDSLIAEPKANIFKMLFAAGTAVKSVASVRDVTLNSLAVLFLNIVKWIAFGGLFGTIIGKYINAYPFSTVRLNFTYMAKIAIFIAIFGIVCEYLSFLLISIYCGLQRDDVKMRKLADISARGSVLPTVLYVIAILLMIYKNLTIGTIFAIASILIALVLKIYGFTQQIRISVTRQLPIYFLCAVLSLFAFIKVLPYFSEDLLKILANILNI